MIYPRRSFLLASLAAVAAARPALALSPREIQWDDLIPPGVPYSEIVGEGEIDVVNDTWRPVYDSNATKVNQDLDGAYVRMPGYIVPLEINDTGINRFILVPYVGACIHTPPPPPNQLVFVTTDTPWPGDSLWDAVWVTGKMQLTMQSTELAEIGYTLKADKMEIFKW